MGIFEKVLERYELPVEAAGVFRLTMTGNSRLNIENFRGLLEYSPENIIVDCKNLRLRIGGEKLYIIAMKKEGLIIGGQIFCVELI